MSHLHHIFSRSLSALIVAVQAATMTAQTAASAGQPQVINADRNIFSHLEVGVGVGTTGIGIDLATHITQSISTIISMII